ncbi:MAG TPA: helix-turn-helix transcriptional regulator [Candidatus Acidoferrum sp.]|nr:helix-turn-helix transcriptional regulator [Candidatus Acidoferrum sp.]
MDVCFVIQQRLKELGLEQRDLAAAAQVTESYISQLLTRKKAPPAAGRTDLYEKMNAFLKLPKGQLSAMVEAQRREELKKKLADPPAPLFKEVRELIIRKCKTEKRTQVREIFENQAFGELERLVTQTLLDVTKGIAREELETENWPWNASKLRRQSPEEMRAITLDFLDTDVFNVSIDHCAAFLDPLIDSWDIDLKTFGMEIELNNGLGSSQFLKFQFVETGSADSSEEEPGFQEFLHNAALSGDATGEEMGFLKSLRFRQKRPSALYYYRELQSLRDPLHFSDSRGGAMHKRRDAEDVEKLMRVESRKNAIRRWSKNRKSPRKNGKAKLS